MEFKRIQKSLKTSKETNEYLTIRRHKKKKELNRKLDKFLKLKKNPIKRKNK